MDNSFEIKLPYSIGEMIAFHVENSPIIHGKIVDFVMESQHNTVKIVGCKIKTKNSSTRTVYFHQIIS